MVESARTEGLSATYAKVRGRLGEPNALGYSLCGVVLDACEGSPAAPGELVACAGAGKASHAEIVSVPRQLCARVPADVAAEQAAYATVGAIALHGIRLAKLGLGDVAAVIGLGLVGQITLQLLAAAGCVAFGVDPDPRRAGMARENGFYATTDPAELVAEVRRNTSNRGADGVLVTAASKSAAPLAVATEVARERATISIVGDVLIESPRAPLFSKELQLVVSRSYGPGRYDPIYEERGIDYPAGYVRWTEGRNLEEVLRLIADGRFRPERLTTHTFDLEEGARAYELLGTDELSLGILLRYERRLPDQTRLVRLTSPHRRRALSGKRVSVGVVGAGTFARTVLMPELAKRASLSAVVARTGPSAIATAKRFGAGVAATDGDAVVRSESVDAVVVATRHNLHVQYAVAALRAGKHVFVEKPLALSELELTELESVASVSPGILMVGFNRRFAPLAIKLRSALSGRGPLIVNYRINAGRLPPSHWTHDPREGGGRIVGEMCHFVDFATFLCDGEPELMCAAGVAGASEPIEDDIVATLRFPNSSLATVTYSALGDPSLPKERVEVLGESGAAVLDDFALLSLHQQGRTKLESAHRDKGHAKEIEVFLDACRTGRQPWPVEQMAAVTRATFALRAAVLVRAA